MAKLGIPLHGIEQKLLMDQVEQSVMEQILEKLGGANSSPVFSSKTNLKEATALSRVKLQRLHWMPIDANNLSASSLWVNVAKKPDTGRKSTDGDLEDDITVTWNNKLSPEEEDMINNDLTATLDEQEVSEVERFFGIDYSKIKEKR